MGTDIKKRLIIFAVVSLIAVLFLYPTLWVGFKKLTGQEVTASEMIEGGLFSKPIGLGLDLSGGVHLVYQVEVKEAVASRLQADVAAIRSGLRKAKIPVTRAKVNKDLNLEITLLSARTLEKAKSFIRDEWRSLQYVDETDEAGRVKLRYGYQESHIKGIETQAVLQAVETLRNRVDQFGVAEPLIQKVGVDRILLQMPGEKDIEAVKAVVGKVAKLEFRLLPRPGATNVVTIKDRETGSPVRVEDEVLLTGAAVDDARVAFDGNQQVEVSLTFTGEGGKTFSRITGESVGRNMAIILDGEMYSAPVIRERISGGRCSISGGFSLIEARQLAVVLRAGALPAPLKVLEERTVGPSLGKESIRKGIMAILIGFALVLGFMVVYYKKSGVLAVAILVVNVIFVLALLSAFGATLTLPGLAGLALTVGMAVDANVIIFERIREEVRNGSSRDVAVAGGFEKALSAIIDSNVTTLLAGIILFYFGSGPIRGFAVTLSVGIITTIFCATFLARLGFDFFTLENKDGLSI